MGLEASYGRGGHASGDARSDLYVLTGLVGFALGGTGRVELMPVAGVGALVHARRSASSPGLDATRTGPGVTLGLRTTLPLRSVRVFAAGSYVLGLGDVNSPAFPTELLGVTAGVTIPIGR